MSSAPISIDAALSPAMSRKWPTLSPGERSIDRKYRPARTGESMSVTSETGEKETASPATRSTGRAVPNFQPDGNVNVGWNIVSLDRGPRGYSSTDHQLTYARRAVAVVYAERDAR